MLASSTRMLRNAKRNGGHQRRQEAALRQSQDREDKAGPDDSHIPQGPQPQHGFGSQVFRVNIDIRPSLGKQNGREVSPPVLMIFCSLLCVVGMECGIRISHGGFFL